MKPYKVAFVASTFQARKALTFKNEGVVNGYTLSRDLEALILEEDKAGYELVNLSPVASNVEKFGMSLSITQGMLVTFRAKNSE